VALISLNTNYRPEASIVKNHFRKIATLRAIVITG